MCMHEFSGSCISSVDSILSVSTNWIIYYIIFISKFTLQNDHIFSCGLEIRDGIATGITGARCMPILIIAVWV